MTAYCSPCNRSFKGQGALDQHMRHSASHKKRSQKPLQDQALQQENPGPIKPKQRKNHGSPPASGGHEAKPAKPQQSLESTYRVHRTTTARKDEQLRNSTASSSNATSATNPTITNVPHAVAAYWSSVPESQHMLVLDSLSAHCHSVEELEGNGYLVRPYDPQDYVDLRKCKQCHTQERKLLTTPECTFHPAKRNKWNRKRPYKCCTTEGRGCSTLPTHDFQVPLRATKHKEFLRTPASSAVVTKSRAVTLDCEMAGVADGTSETIFLCVTDYITGAILINHFIFPTEKIIEMRSSIHGISKSTLDSAVQQGQALSGWTGARHELWKYIDDSTILVGHALENELDALRIIHPRVVDSGILARSAVGIPRRQWGLKTLCSELLGVDIRKNKGGIHDCMEDVLATREVVLFCVRNKEAFHRWAKAKRGEEIHLEEKRKAARQKKKEKKARRDTLSAGLQGGIGRPGRDYTSFQPDDDNEVLSWSDLAEEFGWPHPDTGYYPWSD